MFNLFIICFLKKLLMILENLFIIFLCVENLNCEIVINLLIYFCDIVCLNIFMNLF